LPGGTITNENISAFMRSHGASFGVVLAAIILAAGNSAFGNPSGGTVRQGTATFSSSGSQLTINTSAQAFISWQSFNIAAGETTTFVQPSSSSLVWNQINDPNPSQILGNLNANGYVVLQNQNGFYIGGQAAISAHGLIMTTSPIPMPDLSSGGPWSFSAPPPTASIINYGKINIGGGGSAFLIADDIENNGSITAQGGNIGLYAGQQVLVSTRPDGRGLSAAVTLPEGSVNNSGQLIADGGSIAMRAKVVNQGGLVQANTAASVNGTIELIASDAVNFGANSVISAKGAGVGASSGGSVTVKSGNTFSDQAGSTINIAGGAQGGDGGQVEISAANLDAIQSRIDGHAASGFLGGTFTIDPTELNLTSAFVSSLTPTFSSGLYQINLQADDTITVGTLWNLSDPGGAALLNLTAGNDIIFNDGSGISAGNNWSVSLAAGPQSLLTKPTTPRTDGIYLDGSSFVQTQNGDINVSAANEVLINANTATATGNGIRTLAGGNIDVTTQLGDVNTGGNTAGYIYQSTAPYYKVSQTLGGISTAAGGNVTIDAGGDVKSLIPSGTSTILTADGGTGAFGPKPGNVTITASGNVYGHYVVADGAGIITAKGGDVGASAGNPFALSLINGSWAINALNGNIYLQEVRNPNGDFNNKGFGSSPGHYLFDYSPMSSVALDAGIGVYLTDQGIPRPDPNAPIPVIYPPTLTINAGSGGVTMEGSVILFPSPYGDLNITTTGGGNFESMVSGTTLPELIMSDSSQTRWIGAGTFGDLDHGTTLAELNNPDPVVLDVSGSMENLTLLTTKATQITVGGDMINANFSGENLHSDDITSIHVGGQIFYPSPYTYDPQSLSIPALPAADLPPGVGNSWDSIFKLLMDPQEIANLAIPANVLPSQYADFANQAALFPVFGNVLQTGNPGFVYNPATGRFGYSGSMPQNVYQDFTQPLVVLRYGKDGFPLTTTTTDPTTGLPVTHFVTDTVSWAPSSQVAVLFQDSQGAPDPNNPQYGLRVGGPGQFNICAGSISLGNSYGILSEGVDDVALGRYLNLAPVTPLGATLNVTVDGDLSMLTSTIATMGGGDVNVNSGGAMDLGSQDLFGNPQRQIGFGIYSTGRGNVNVSAVGDIDINGSRIASYNGGNISVESLTGDVNAGSGGANFIQVGVSYVDPLTGKAGIYLERVFGSGIVANTLVDPSQVPGASAVPGNITVETPQGDIVANQGGIVQEALNGNVSAGPTVTLVAGTPASDGSPGYAGNIDLGTSGVIGGTVNATANGNITGLIISRQNSSISAAETFSGTVLSGGQANLSASSVSGTSTIIGVGGVSVAGALGSGAQVLGQNVSVNGGASQSTLGTSATASTASQSAANTATSDAEKQVANNDDSGDDEKKKKHKGPALAHRVGRVTVLLPAKS
jgi:filamentous hemagglutinin family protein